MGGPGSGRKSNGEQYRNINSGINFIKNVRKGGGNTNKERNSFLLNLHNKKTKLKSSIKTGKQY